MHGNILMTLLETTVFLNVVQVVATNDYRSLHLGGNHQPLQDTSTDTDFTGKRTLAIDVVAFHSGGRRLDTESNILDVSHGLVGSGLAGYKNGILFLVGFFVLIALGVLAGDAGHAEGQG